MHGLRQDQFLEGEENLLVVQVSVCYILKHLKDRKAGSVHIYCACCHINIIFKLQRRSRLTLRFSIHSLKIQMSSHPCNKSEQITLSYLVNVNYLLLVFLCLFLIH